MSILTSLRQLRLGSNQLSGSIPDVSTLTSLEYLYLNDNQLSGSLPATLGTLNSLTRFWLNNNQLTGPSPDWRGMTKLEDDYLILVDNNLCRPTMPAALVTWLDAKLYSSTFPDCPASNQANAPAFSTRIADQVYLIQGTFSSTTLPQATGGSSPFTYRLTPAQPAGLTYDETLRKLTGTPTMVTDPTDYT